MKTIEYKGILFRIIPDKSMYAVSQCGKILDSKGLLTIKAELDERPKLNYLLDHGGGYCYIVRLVWRIWTKDNLFCAKIYHEDGDIHNCHLSNLRVKQCAHKISECPKYNNIYLQKLDKPVKYPPKIITIEDLNPEDVLKAPTTSSTISNKFKLAEYQIDEIVALLASKELTQGQIANRYGVSRATVNRINNKQTWRFKL